MKKILIDCDPGHDDAIAILTAIAQKDKLDILGISTVGGNQTLEKVTQNAKNILAFVGSSIPLVTGNDKPLIKQLETSDEAHGESGMDGPYFNGLDYPVKSTNAVTFMYDKLINSKEKVTIVGLGPLTNIALLLKTYPECHEKIEEISIMGGGISRGNVTSTAEFNIYVDPEAANIVFNSGIRINMSGLDVTEKAEITVSEIQQLKNKGRISHLVFELLKFYNASGRQFGFINSPIHDLCAIMYLINSDIFGGKDNYVSVETKEGTCRGLTYADKRIVSPNNKNTFVFTDVDRERFIQVLFESLTTLDKEYVL